MCEEALEKNTQALLCSLSGLIFIINCIKSVPSPTLNIKYLDLEMNRFFSGFSIERLHEENFPAHCSVSQGNHGLYFLLLLKNCHVSVRTECNSSGVYKLSGMHLFRDITQAFFLPDYVEQQAPPADSCSWCVEHQSRFALQRETTVRGVDAQPQKSPSAVGHVQTDVHRSVCFHAMQTMSFVL